MATLPSTTDIIFTSTENVTNDEINQFYFYEVGQEYLLIATHQLDSLLKSLKIYFDKKFYALIT